jgi:hypothetical protein
MEEVPENTSKTVPPLSIWGLTFVSDTGPPNSGVQVGPRVYRNPHVRVSASRGSPADPTRE